MNTPTLSTSEEARAPWNQKEYSTKKETVSVSITISKTIQIDIEPNDEVVETDEDGNKCVYNIYEDDNLNNTVIQSGKLPNLNGWNLDDIAVILE